MKVSLPPIDGDQEEAIAWLAEHKVIPVKSPWGGGYTLRRLGEKIGSNQHLFGRKTTEVVIENLGISNDQQCERIRERIKNHPNWDT